ncbi:MAG: ECF transporter S component [Clostridia bacterium]|nr:ECF transporter S component [Clostridia bacterium]
MKKYTVKLCLSAVFTAMFVVLDYYADAISKLLSGTIKISLSGLPIIIVAVVFGPLWGGAVGLVGSLVSQMLSYGFTATTVFWVLPATLRGIVAGLLFIMLKKSIKPHILAINTVISSLVVTAFNTLAMYIDAKVYKYPVVLFGAALVNRIVIAVITAVIFAVLVPPIVILIKKIIKE